MKLTVLAYHEIGPLLNKINKRTMGKTCFVSKQIFDDQIKWISQNYFKTLTIKDLDFIRSSKDIIDFNKVCIITFDDGNIGNYQYAFPILKKYNQKAIFFVTTNLIGSKDMMTWEQIAEMQREGMDIQSHGVTHEPFENLNDIEVSFELQDSKTIIESQINVSVSAVSLPHGSYHKRLYKLSKNIGYKYIFDSYISYNNIHKFKLNNINNDNDVCYIHRIPIVNSSDSIFLSKILFQNKLYIFFQRTKQVLKLFIKNIIGINNYRRIYRIINGIQLNS